jgi:hypothetical protein
MLLSEARLPVAVRNARFCGVSLGLRGGPVKASCSTALARTTSKDE